MLSTLCLVALPFLAAVSSAVPDPSDLLEEGLAASQAGRLDDAVRSLKKAADESPDDPQTWLVLGNALLDQGDSRPVETEEQWQAAEGIYREAEDVYRHILDRNSRHVGAWCGVGRALLRTGRTEEAIATLYQAQMETQGAPMVCAVLADALMAARQFDVQAGNLSRAESRLQEAEAVLTKASEGLDVQADIQRGLGDVLLQKGDTDRAMVAFRKAVQIRPADSALHDSLLRATELSKSFDDSIDFYTKMVEEQGLARWYEARTRELKGHVLFNKVKDYQGAVDQYAEAEWNLRQSANYRPEYSAAVESMVPLLRSYQGYALMRDGDLEGAEAAFLAALDRDPALQNARNGLKSLLDEYWVRQGGEQAGREDFEIIRAFAARLCVAIPDVADCWNNYGFFAREAGRYEESYLAYRRAMNLAPENSRILNDTALILVYHLGRDLDQAEEWLWRAHTLAKAEVADARQRNRRDALAAATEAQGDALVNLVVLYNGLKDTDKAVEVLDQLIEEFPERREIRMWERRLRPASRDDSTGTGDAGSGDAKGDDTKGGDGKAGDGKAGDGKAGDGKAGDGKAGDGKGGAAKGSSDDG